ncbi:MAG: hypothetical protein OSJ41_04650 [Duncaniella sp.]|nr:hypothetical protein [Duncaniella sp.]
MNIRLFLLSLISCVCISATAKGLVDTSADHGLMVRQIPGSESDAIAFFKGLPVECDTIYATIFRPANCPRCDGFLNEIDRSIKTYTDKPSVLIAVYPDSVMAKAYINKYDIKADHYIFDTTEAFDKFLSFSPGYLHVGYILKFNISTGELIVGSNADNVSPAFFKELNLYRDKKEAYRFPAGSYRRQPVTEHLAGSLVTKESYHLDTLTAPTIMSEIIYQPLFHGNNLIWNDKLAEVAYHFAIDNARGWHFISTLEVDSTQAATFADIPAEYYNKMLISNQLKNIALQPFVIDSDKIGIPYSLPELWMDANNGINYRNKPCYLVKSLTDSTRSELIPLNYDYEDKFFYPHFYMKSNGDDIVVGVQRLTWPLIYDKEEYMHDAESNPFNDEFYDCYPQPALASFDKQDGTILYRFGALPSFAKKTKTGYSFADMLFDSYGDEAVYASAYDGSVYISPRESLDCADCRRDYSAFDIDISKFATPDTTDFYTYNCNSLAEPYLSRKLVDIKADKRRIHCLMRLCSDAFERPDLEEYRYIIIDRMTGNRSTYSYPSPTDGEHRMGYGLRRTHDGQVEPYFISKHADGWTVTLLE